MKKPSEHPCIFIARLDEYKTNKESSECLWLDMLQSHEEIEQAINKFIKHNDVEYIICDFENFGQLKIDTDESLATLCELAHYIQRYGINFIDPIYQRYPSIESVLAVLSNEEGEFDNLVEFAKSTFEENITISDYYEGLVDELLQFVDYQKIKHFLFNDIDNDYCYFAAKVDNKYHVFRGLF